MAVIIVRRVSDGFYSYKIYLYSYSESNDLVVIDEDICGELIYWGREGEKDCNSVINELLERNGISDVEIYHCGGFYQDECPEHVVEKIKINRPSIVWWG